MKDLAGRAEWVRKDAVLISHHARVRMFERNISTDDLLEVIHPERSLRTMLMMSDALPHSSLVLLHIPHIML
jgi:hypothetical protein